MVLHVLRIRESSVRRLMETTASSWHVRRSVGTVYRRSLREETVSRLSVPCSDRPTAKEKKKTSGRSRLDREKRKWREK